MRRRAVLATVGFFLSLSLFAAAPASAGNEAEISAGRLEQLFRAYLKDDRNVAFNDQRIAEERNRIRLLLQQEIDGILQFDEREEKTLAPAAVIESQRRTIDDLTGRLNERSADLHLLTDEEQLYREGKTGTGENAAFLLTKSLPELLARKAVLEEDIDLLQAALSTQEKRLGQLLAEQRRESIGVIFGVLWYIGIVFLAFWMERLIRTHVILRIPHRGMRYALAKIFTMVVYLGILVWLVQRVLMEHPGLLTILAVVGAALIFMVQDIIKSFIGWLAYKDAVALGQRVRIGEYTGDVLDVGMFSTTLLVARSPGLVDVTQAGKIVRIPNAALLTGPLLNYHSTSDYENVEIPVRLAKPEDWERAKRVLETIVLEESQHYASYAKEQMDKRMRGFYFSQVSPSSRVHLEFTPKGRLMCLLCFPAPIGQRRTVVTRVMERVLTALKEEAIQLGEGE